MGKKIYKTNKWKWREWFSKSVLQYGEQDERNGRLIEFEADPSGSGGKGVTAGGFRVAVSGVPTSYSECRDSAPWNWRKQSYLYGDQNTYSSHSCDCSQGMTGQLCRHLASFMVHWEKIRGPFEFTQTEEEYQEELLREKLERERRIREEEEEKERKRREEEYRRKAEQRRPVLAFLRESADLPKIVPGTVFKPDVILGNLETDLLQEEVYAALPSSEKLPEIRVDVDYAYDTGEQVLKVSSEPDGFSVYMELGRKNIYRMRCDCGSCRFSDRSYYAISFGFYKNTMCGHAMAVYRSLWNRIARENPGDETDRKGMRFLSVIAGNAVPSPQTDAVVEKAPVVELTPRITPIRGELQIAFSAGLQGERSYMVRGLEKFYNAVESNTAYELSKKTTIDFGRMTFTPQSARWYDFISTRVRNIDRINRRLMSGSNWYYTVKQLSIGSGVPLDGSDLDIIYSLAEGTQILYKKETEEASQTGRRGRRGTGSSAARGGEVLVTAGPGKLGIKIVLLPEKGDDGRLTAVRLSAEMPRLLRGNQYQYILDEHQFGRISQEEMEALLPFLEIAGDQASFSCVIGRRKFPEFYYRVLPALQESLHVEIEDKVGDPGTKDLPPEPAFTFYLDRVEEAVTCRAVVAYGEEKFMMAKHRQNSFHILRDEDQEKRVLQTVLSLFPEEEEEPGMFAAPREEEGIVRILTEGIAALSRLGIVKGSDAFYSLRLRPAPRPSFRVSLESGILDLSISTKDLTEAELLELLASYRTKQRWHRLKSGDFVDLRDAETFRELEDLTEELNVSMEELIRGGVRLPEYRALYVDRLLEEHDDIVTARDRHFKSLIRSFRTIRDADYEVPEALEDTLRPYQIHGFRWISTLAQAGFGGILADEMGLGKTVQMLAFLQTQYREDGTKPALVVCPASLVYNWKEECAQFTPELPAVTLAGNLSQRKKEINAIGTGKGSWLLITSYDLLKRDITLYKDVSFSTIVLDEAQFVKNRNTAVSKAVRVLQASHRFALTGTPIENRLSELWSIFDFLMPGFLYTAKEFSERFELPVMKRQDAAASGRLASMVSPFILRRKKADVLKDLPEKLEETRSSSMEGEQRRLYDAQVVQMKKMLKSFGGTGEEKLRVLAQITRLRQICCDPSLVFDNYKGASAKREACMDLIRSAMDGGHRMLLFSQFTSMMDLLAKDLKKENIPFFTITGATPKQERLRLVNAFNSGDTPVFLISLRAGGTGLNLTGADVVIHYDPWWNLAVQNQATDRAHRIGQTRQVTEIRLIAAHSIEEKIIELQEAKRELADAVIGAEGASLMSLSPEELLQLLS